jgi:plasmid stabilization system protein ParE
MIVVISDAAEAELEAIGDWIAEANHDASPLVCHGAPAPVRSSLGYADGFPASSAL